jgi:CBS domain-containing protein
MIVKEFMTENPACCSPATPIPVVARMMIDHDCGCIPVVEDKRPVGVITDRDIVTRSVAGNRDPSKLKAEDCMTKDCVTVGPEMGDDECCKVMEDNQIRRAIVVDEDGAICGIVAQADLARHSQVMAGEVVQAVSQPSQYAHAVS